MSGCRRLWALIRGLPPDSAVQRNGKAWTQHDELVATLIERGDFWGHWQTVGTRAFKKVPALSRIEHPDRPTASTSAALERERRMSTREEIARFVGQVQGRG